MADTKTDAEATYCVELEFTWLRTIEFPAQSAAHAEQLAREAFRANPAVHIAEVRLADTQRDIENAAEDSRSPGAPYPHRLQRVDVHGIEVDDIQQTPELASKQRIDERLEQERITDERELDIEQEL